jgi:hypothetical protein
MAAARIRRSDPELQAASRHLKYEIDMLMSVALALAAPEPKQHWETNSLLESFVVHFRNLVDVFYPGANSKPDDVLASDFFDVPEQWDSIRPPQSDVFGAARIRVHKEIAHLTYARLHVPPQEKGWDIGRLVGEMDKVVSAFRGSVASHRLAWSEA